MDSHPIVDNGIVPETPPPAADPRPWSSAGSGAEAAPAGEVRFPGEDGGKSLAAMAQHDLVGTLQLLAERAQYITGATGAAIALRDNGEMTCRARAGTSAPEVGAHLQVDSGVSGESVRTRKTLRCDDAATDGRVNRESCEALGIASVVVMPLVRGDDVVGVFELFSDKPHVFQARDITALERMGAMVFTAMEHALVALQAKADTEAAEVAAEPASHGANGEARPEEGLASTVPADETSGNGSFAFHDKMLAAIPASDAAPSEGHEADNILAIAPEAEPRSESQPAAQADGLSMGEASTGVADVPEVVLLPVEVGTVITNVNSQKQDTAPTTRSEASNVRRCEGCGFPVSEGRHYCLDCERKAAVEQQKAAKAARGSVPAMWSPAPTDATEGAAEAGHLPQFLQSEPPQASWLATHKYAVGAIAIALAGIAVFLLAR